MSTCLAWALRSGARALWLTALLLATGCGTVPSPPGSDIAYLQRAHRRELALTWGMGSVPQTQPKRSAAEHEPAPASSCAPVPDGWPEEASGDQELLAPFLGCPSVGGFLALQRQVDMVKVVERLGDWGAVRLGALGPLEGPAAKVLQRKRFSFLVNATQRYGAYAQVLTLFLVDTAFDDEVHELLGLLAKDKQLQQTLGQMEAVREQLERRGFKLSNYPERQEQLRDVVRGLGRAADDVASTVPVGDGLRGGDVFARRAELPPPYQQAFEETFQSLMREHFAPGHAALGAFDQMTFGVPLGFYHLGVGTAHGLGELWQGHYEQATRELTPAALVVGLYAGGKGARYLAAREGAGARLGLPELRLEVLRSVAWKVAERLGVDGLGDLARYIRASREAAVFVGAGGEPAAVALYEARGNVARAQAWLSEARPERAGAPEPRAAPSGALGGVASLVDEAAGLSAEVVEAKLQQAELEAPGPRLPADVALLNKLHSMLTSPPPGVPEGYALWEDYRTYRQRRLTELERGKSTEGPLRWEAYERMRGLFARGLVFERAMVELLRADASLPLVKRQWLKGFNQPRIEVHVGVSKQGVPGIRYADVLVIEGRPPAGQPPRVETFSFKSRYLAPLDPEPRRDQIKADARAALAYYGGTLDIRRPSLKGPVQVQRVRLVYEGGALLPEEPGDMKDAMNAVKKDVPGVEVLVQ
jgi:hypothetical protein